MHFIRHLVFQIVPLLLGGVLDVCWSLKLVRAATVVHVIRKAHSIRLHTDPLLKELRVSHVRPQALRHAPTGLDSVIQRQGRCVAKGQRRIYNRTS